MNMRADTSIYAGIKCGCLYECASKMIHVVQPAKITTPESYCIRETSKAATVNKHSKLKDCSDVKSEDHFNLKYVGSPVQGHMGCLRRGGVTNLLGNCFRPVLAWKMFARSKRFSGVMTSVFHVAVCFFSKLVRPREVTETRSSYTRPRESHI